MSPCHVCFFIYASCHVRTCYLLDHLGVCMQGEHNLLSAAIAGVRVLMPLCSSSSLRISLVYIATKHSCCCLSYSLKFVLESVLYCYFIAFSFYGDSGFAILSWRTARECPGNVFILIDEEQPGSIILEQLHALL